VHLWPHIQTLVDFVSVNDDRHQLDATIVIYYHKYLYMFREFIWPSSGVQVVCYCIWCSALDVVAVVLRSRCVVLGTVCKFVSGYKLTHSAQHLVLNTICSSIQPVLLKMGI